MKVYYDKDADLSLIKGKQVTIVVGYCAGAVEERVEGFEQKYGVQIRQLWGMTETSPVSTQTAAGANQTSASAHELSRLAVELNSLVSKFKT